MAALRFMPRAGGKSDVLISAGRAFKSLKLWKRSCIWGWMKHKDMETGTRHKDGVAFAACAAGAVRKPCVYVALAGGSCIKRLDAAG